MEIDNENETPTTAVSLYGDTSDAMDDFPILKAFQEYVDKEQAKARHRMTAMTILFMFILFTVAGGLSFVIYTLNLRNQALNDRLIDFAMKEREVPAQQVVQPQPAPQPVVVQPPQDNSALVAMVESLKTLIQEQKAVQSAPPPPQPAPVVQEPQGPSPEQIAMEKKLKEQQERIEKTAALLKAQEEAIAAQKAQLREQELEAYRRKHYPEYYQRLEQQQIQQQIEAEQPAVKKPQTQPKAVKRPPAKRPQILEVVEDIEVDDDELEDMLDTEDDDIEDIETDDDELEDYYNEDDEDYSIPVDSGANWLIPKE